MLNLDVCEKCLCLDRKTGRLARDWIKISGLIACGAYNTYDADKGYELKLVSIKGSPPKECPYKFEHGVAEAMK